MDKDFKIINKGENFQLPQSRTDLTKGKFMEIATDLDSSKKNKDDDVEEG